MCLQKNLKMGQIYEELIRYYSELYDEESGNHFTPRDVVAHSDIAPLRKTDPGPAFDWCKLYDHLIRNNDNV